MQEHSILDFPQNTKYAIESLCKYARIPEYWKNIILEIRIKGNPFSSIFYVMSLPQMFVIVDIMILSENNQDNGWELLTIFANNIFHRSPIELKILLWVHFLHSCKLMATHLSIIATITFLSVLNWFPQITFEELESGKEVILEKRPLAFSWQRFLLYRNQSIDLQSKSMQVNG